MRKPISFFLIFALTAALLSACRPGTVEATPTEAVERWQLVGQYDVRSLNLLVGFHNENLGVSVGDDGYVLYTHDGGQTWPEADNNSMGLYGLEIVDDQAAIACGNGRHVRLSVDGGVTWQLGTDFGAGFPGHCRFLSFLDAQSGWAATPTLLGVTSDGGATWDTPGLPQGAGPIAAIALYAPGQGYLLDTSGSLFATDDNGLSWTLAGGPLPGGITISSLSYQTAALRFQDSGRGMLVIAAIVDGAGQVLAYQTTDGGQTWAQETIPATYGAPYLSRDGRYLTLLTPPYKVTLMKYNGD